jgi:N-glycosylase/DNA lyase
MSGGPPAARSKIDCAIRTLRRVLRTQSRSGEWSKTRRLRSQEFSAPHSLCHGTERAGDRRALPRIYNLESLTNAMSETVFSVRHYDLAATFQSGQAFRWRHQGRAWEGVVGGRWVRLIRRPNILVAETAELVNDWTWLAEYLQVDIELDRVIGTFPRDEPMQRAVQACHGLRLLRQAPWECLASFILSSTKQIIQIQQIIELLCQRYGEPLAVPAGHEPAFSFPGPETLARVSEAELRACKMGFRAPNLLATAGRVVSGETNLEAIRTLPLADARVELLKLPGVGRKIADCVLLFGYGFPQAFPIDVWVMKGLREMYFRGRKVKLRRLMKFSETHFGPYAGYAQQYLFHYARVGGSKSKMKS